MNNDKVKISYNGNEYLFPLIKGTQNEKAIDISSLRKQTGLITLDVGLKNTGSTTSKITFLDGERGILHYRGYDIEYLAENTTFLETAHLLIYGKLPSSTEKTTFESAITRHTLVNEDIRKIFDGFPISAHPMGILCSLVASLTAFYPNSDENNQSEERINKTIIRLIAKIPTLAAWCYKSSMGHPVNYPDNRLDYCSNFLKMMFQLPTEPYDVNPVFSKAFNKLLILHADHEQNCSAATVRIVGSSLASLYISISAGISALWGKLHGGANQAVIEMLENILEDGNNIQKYIEKAKDKKDTFRLMGFGHRVYKNFDPRAKIIKKICDEVLTELGIHDPILEIAKELEEIALKDSYFKEKKLYPNVDFYSGIIYKALGIPKEMFTVMFSLGRLPGWIAQWKEMREQNQPIGRPRQIYMGKTIEEVKAGI